MTIFYAYYNSRTKQLANTALIDTTVYNLNTKLIKLVGTTRAIRLLDRKLIELKEIELKERRVV
jgi:hypothetical protein